VFQQYTTIPYGDTHKLSLHITQASQDLLVGGPYNYAQFAMLLSIVAKEVGMVPDKLFINIGDAHIYANQLSALKESDLLGRRPRKLSTLLINPKADIWDLKHDDFTIVNYSNSPFVKLIVST
jgi:thymidylate synthase